MARRRNNKKHSSNKKKAGNPEKDNGKGQAEASSVQPSSSEALQYPEMLEGAAEGRQGQATPSSASFEDAAKPEELKNDDCKGKGKGSSSFHGSTSLRGNIEIFSPRMEEGRRAHSLVGEGIRDNTGPSKKPPLLHCLYSSLSSSLFPRLILPSKE